MVDEMELAQALMNLQNIFIAQFKYLIECGEEIPEEAFEEFSDNLIEQYAMLYDQFASRYRVEIEREIALQKMRREKLVPFSWRTRFLKKYRQNTAMDMVDSDTDEEAKQFFADWAEEIAAKYLTGAPPLRADGEERLGEWEVVGELKEIADEPETAEKGARDWQEGASAAEDGQESDPAATPAEGAKSASESVAEDKTEEPKKGRIRRKKEKRGKIKNDGENDQDRQSAGDSP